MLLAPSSAVGPYSVTAKIGEGGMGEVFRARDTKLDRDVAPKVLPQVVGTWSVMRRFSTMRLAVVVTSALMSAGACAIPLQATSSIGYTLAQAEAGEAQFETKCGGCHLPDSRGERRAPPLTGRAFLDRWGERPVRELFARMRNGMPPYDVRPSAKAYTGIIAYLLQASGLPCGTEALDPMSHEALAGLP